MGSSSLCAENAPFRPPLLVPDLPATDAISVEKSLGTESSLQTPTVETLIRDIIIAAVEEPYVDDKKWNRTKRIFDGLKVDGLRISKRKKRVNHGLWQRYRVQLIKPEETLEIEVKELELAKGDDRKVVPFELMLRVRARCEATFVNWVLGVKGLNGTTVARATISIRIRMEVSPKVDFSNGPLPLISLQPHVRDVDFWLNDLDLQRIGALRDVKLLGDGMRGAVEELMQQQEKKVKKKLQKKLDEL